MGTENYTSHTVEQITANFLQIKQEILQFLDTYPETYTTMSESERNGELRIAELQVLKRRCDVHIRQGNSDAQTLHAEISQYDEVVKTLSWCHPRDSLLYPFYRIAVISGYFFAQGRKEEGAAWAQKTKVYEIDTGESPEAMRFHLGCYFFEHYRDAREKLFALKCLREIVFKVNVNFGVGVDTFPKLTDKDRRLALTLLQKEIPFPETHETKSSNKRYKKLVDDYINEKVNFLMKFKNQLDEKDRLLRSVKTLQSKIGKVLVDSKKMPTKAFLPAHIQATLQLQIDTLAQLIVDMKEKSAQLEKKSSLEQSLDVHSKTLGEVPFHDHAEVIRGLDDDGKEAEISICAAAQTGGKVNEKKHSEVIKSASEILDKINEEFESFLEDRKSANDFFENRIRDLPNKRTAELCLENVRGTRAFLNSGLFIFEIRKSRKRSNQYVHLHIYVDVGEDLLEEKRRYPYDDPHAQKLLELFGMRGGSEKGNFLSAIRVDSKQAYHGITIVNEKGQQVFKWVADEKNPQQYSNILAFFKNHSDKTYSDELHQTWLKKIYDQALDKKWGAVQNKALGMYVEDWHDRGLHEHMNEGHYATEIQVYAEKIQDVTCVTSEPACFIGKFYLSKNDSASKLKGLQFLCHAASFSTKAGDDARWALRRQLSPDTYHAFLDLEEKNEETSTTATPQEIQQFFKEIKQPYVDYCSALNTRAGTKFDAAMNTVIGLITKLKKNTAKNQKSIQSEIWFYQEAEQDSSVEAKKGLSVASYVANIEALYSRILQASHHDASLIEYKKDIDLFLENIEMLSGRLACLLAAHDRKLHYFWPFDKGARAGLSH